MGGKRKAVSVQEIFLLTDHQFEQDSLVCDGSVIGAYPTQAGAYAALKKVVRRINKEIEKENKAKEERGWVLPLQKKLSLRDQWPHGERGDGACRFIVTSTIWEPPLSTLLCG